MIQINFHIKKKSTNSERDFSAFLNQTTLPTYFAYVMQKGACVSDMPTETGVMIMDNCEKGSEGGSLEEVAFGHYTIGRSHPPSPFSTPSMFYGQILLLLPGSPRSVK